MINRLRNFGAVAIVGLASLIGSGCGDGTNNYTSTSDIVYSEIGKVISKEHHDKSYLNPLDDLNPMNDIDPFFDFKKGRVVTMTPEQNKIRITYSKGSIELDNKELFGKVKTNSPVRVYFSEVYEIKEDSARHVLERKLVDYKVIRVLPDN